MSYPTKMQGPAEEGEGRSSDIEREAWSLGAQPLEVEPLHLFTPAPLSSELGTLSLSSELGTLAVRDFMIVIIIIGATIHEN